MNRTTILNLAIIIFGIIGWFPMAVIAQQLPQLGEMALCIGYTFAVMLGLNQLSYWADRGAKQ